MTSLHPTLSDEAFVEEVYQRFLQRPADDRGRTFYVNRLREGASRLDVMFGIVTGEEFFFLLSRQAFGPQTGSGNAFLKFAPPGHFYSPIPATADFAPLEHVDAPLTPDIVPGVDLNVAGQLAWLETLQPYAADLAFPEDAPAGEQHRQDAHPGDAYNGDAHPGDAHHGDAHHGDAPPQMALNATHGGERPATTTATTTTTPGGRYYTENGSFAIGDAVLLSTLIRHLRPARIVEAGAGHSTAVMLDVVERYLDRSVRVETIDPDPVRVRALLRGDEGTMLTVHETVVQQAPLDLFTSLRANDILFIDSSHVLKVGSDLSFLLFEVLPRLAPGVFVHFHDVAWPFEYPYASYQMGRAWNEAYVLRAFLMHNQDFRIVLFADYLMRAQRDAVLRHLPMATRQPRGIPEGELTACSLWLEKIA